MTRASLVKTTILLALAFATLFPDAPVGQAQQPATSRRIVVLDGREVVEGEAIVRYRSEAGTIERERAEFQAASDNSERVGRRGARRLRSRHSTTRQMLAALRANPDVEFAEPNYIIRAHAVPNDPSINLQWGLINTGQPVDGQPGVAGADIGAAAAWDITTGSRANIVAILDTGLDFSHPDLAANVFTAPRQFQVTIDSITVTCQPGSHGYNALNNSCAPLDDSGHGTHVAGIIGAVGNNNIGVSGVNWIANLMPLKILDQNGTGTTTDAIKAIEFAIQAKAALGVDGNIRVLNASWGGAAYSQALEAEIQAANNADMLFVAAAGSEGTNNDVAPHYPASYTSSNVVSVAAVNNSGALESFSNYGATSVHLAAPGGSTWSTLPSNSYGYLGGTSMSAPHVAGAAALVLSVCPLNTANLKAKLLNSVSPHASLSGKTISGGRLDVNAAVRTCAPNAVINVANTNVAPGAPIQAVVTNNLAMPRDWVGLYSPAANDSSFLDWTYLDGTKTPPTSARTTATITLPAPSTPGTYQLRLFTNGFTKLATSANVNVGTQPSLSINDVTVTEGNSGTTLATFTVTLSSSSSQTVSVGYATANGSATAGSDYAATSGTLNFAPSTLTRQFSVTISGDTTSEPNESFSVNLSNPINATIADGQGVGTITTDEGTPTPSLTVSTPSVAPGGVITAMVSNGPARNNDWIGLYPSGAADGAFQDWWYLNGQKTAPATGQSDVTVQLPAPAAAGAYQLRLFTNGYNKLATADVTVAALPALTINDVAVTEGNSGTTVATFTVTLSRSSSDTVTVSYATASGTATSGTDFAAASGTLTFTPSALTRTITVNVNGDTTAESTETFVVNLSGATNAAISDGQGVGTITTDEGTPTPSLTVSTPTVAPGGVITAMVSNGPARNNDWIGLYTPSAADGAFQDWWYLNGQKTAPATGQSDVTVQLPAPAAAGAYQLRLFTNGYNKLATANVTVASMPVLTINDVSVVEGSSGTATALFTVTLSPASSSTVTVNYATADGSASSASDYTASSGTLTFSPSVTTRTISVAVSGDTTVEPSETFLVNLSAPSNASLSDAQGIGTITTDEGSPTPSITVTSTTVPPGGMIEVVINNPTGNARDWIGLYPLAANDTSFIDWFYLNGQKTAPAVGPTGSVTLHIPAPTQTGSYNVRLFTNGYNKLATSATITVSSSGATTLTVNTPNVPRGGTIEIVVNNGPGNANDWIGIYLPSAADSGFTDWFFLNGQKTAPATGQSTVTVRFPAPSTAGTYEVRLFANGYNKLATSSSIVVSP